MERHVTYCRICGPQCGLVVSVIDGRIVAVRPDRDNPMSQGYCCPKGRAYGELHQGPSRLVTSQRRGADGYEPVDLASATAEIAERFVQVRDQHGPQSIGVFRATQSYFSTLTRPTLAAWTRRVGTSKVFSASTIDQSAKSIAAMRMGSFGSGLHDLSTSDVMMLIGVNPLVSHIGGLDFSFPVANPLARLRQAKERGMKLIVVDPRRTETARHADLFLQVRPGEDAILLAAVINIMFNEAWHDSEFCALHVDNVDRLRRAVSGASVELASARCGVPAEDIVAAATLFGTARRGGAITGTGPDMSPRSNVTEHLVSCLNVIGGRYRRAGEPEPNPGVLRPRVRRAEVNPPRREWENGYTSRVGGYGPINGELPSGILADEILQPGSDRIRALLVVGGNPAACLPDQRRAVAALRELELLVTIDPYMSETARIADFVIAPTLALERADHTVTFEGTFSEPFAQYTEPVLERPPDVVEEWEFLWDLADQMGLHLTTDMIVHAPQDPRFAPSRPAADVGVGSREPRPTSEALLAMFAEGGRLSLDELRQHPHGVMLPDPSATILDMRPEAAVHRLDLLPDDVEGELEQTLSNPVDNENSPFVLVCRRARDVLNTVGRDIAGLASRSLNPAYLNPDDMQELGVEAGSRLLLRSSHGTVRAIAAPDPSLRDGVVSMTHCWGALPDEDDDPAVVGSNPSRLISTSTVTETINHMPRMSSIPVEVLIEPSTGARHD